MKSAVDSLLSLLLFGIMENDNFFCETQIKILYLKRFKNIFIYTWCEDIHSRENMRRSGCPLVHVYFFFGSHSSFVLSYRVLRESLDFLRTELRLFLFRWLKWYARRKLAGNKRPLKVVQKNITWGCGHCFILEDVWSYFHPMDCRRLILRRFLYWINTLEILFV